MKNYRIRYVIRDGEAEYGDEIIEQAADMHHLTAIRIIAAYWVSWAWREDHKVTFSDDLDAFANIPGEAGEFCHKLLKDDFAMIPADTRAIQDVSWEEVQPIIVTIRDGLVEGITYLPAGICIEVHDWESGEINTNGESVPTVSAWEGPL